MEEHNLRTRFVAVVVRKQPAEASHRSVLAKEPIEPAVRIALPVSVATCARVAAPGALLQ